MRFCPNCGAKCNDESIFCSTCGKKLEKSEDCNTEQLTQETVDNTQRARIRYAGGPLGYVNPKIFWPITGILFFFVCLYGRSNFIFGIAIALVRKLDSPREWIYACITLVIAGILAYV